MTENLFNNNNRAGIQAEINTYTIEKVCPYLGLKQDAATSHGYPHNRNMCYRSGQPEFIALKVQSHFCLTGAHESCSIFQQAQLGEPVKGSRARRNWRKRALPSLALALLFVLLVTAALIWWPTPWTSIEDNTSRAAPRQDAAALDDPSAANTAPAVSPAGDGKEEKPADDAVPTEEVGSRGEKPLQDSLAPTSKADVEVPQERNTGGFRVHIYD